MGGSGEVVAVGVALLRELDVFMVFCDGGGRVRVRLLVLTMD